MADRRITKKVIAAGTFHRRVVTLESMNYYSSSRLTRIVYQCENVNMQMWRVPRSGYFTAADVNKPMMMAHRQKTTGVILRIAISVSILWPVDFRLWCVSVCVCVCRNRVVDVGVAACGVNKQCGSGGQVVGAPEDRFHHSPRALAPYDGGPNLSAWHCWRPHLSHVVCFLSGFTKKKLTTTKLVNYIFIF